MKPTRTGAKILALLICTFLTFNALASAQLALATPPPNDSDSAIQELLQARLWRAG